MVSRAAQCPAQTRELTAQDSVVWPRCFGFPCALPTHPFEMALPSFCISALPVMFTCQDVQSACHIAVQMRSPVRLMRPSA